MNFLMLRGKVDERTQKVNDLGDHHDMWTWLLYEMLGEGDYGEVLYWGGKRFREYRWNFFERWIPDFKKSYLFHPIPGRDQPTDFWPQIVIARGGFPEYRAAIKTVPNAFKVYYGAGKRFVPEKRADDWDLILVDSERQRHAVRRRLPHAKCATFFKPAAETVFMVRPEVKKKYDVCFVAANPADERKRVRWVYKTVPRDLRVLQLGMKPKFKVPGNVTVKHVSRETMASHMAQCRVGILPYTRDDSGPRVASEFLACNIPIVIIEGANLHDRFPSERFSKRDFWTAVRRRIDCGSGMEPVALYESRLNQIAAANHLKKLIMVAYYERQLRCRTVLRPIR